MRQNAQCPMLRPSRDVARRYARRRATRNARPVAAAAPSRGAHNESTRINAPSSAMSLRGMSRYATPLLVCAMLPYACATHDIFIYHAEMAMMLYASERPLPALMFAAVLRRE